MVEEKSYIEKCEDERKEMTPKTGYNVVQFDDFSPPGEMLTLIQHFEKKEDAEKFAKDNNSQEMPFYVYGPVEEDPKK